MLSRIIACKIRRRGDANAPSTAIRIREHVLDRLIVKTVWSYLDDITIFSNSIENHIHDIHQVPERLQDHHIRASPSKCNFFADRLPLWGHVIEDQGIHAYPEKI